MISFIFSYIKWHYTKAYIDLASMCSDITIFLLNFFSIPVLFKTLFSRWQMLGESYKKGFDVEEMFGTFVLNFMMRIVGFFVRSATILIGLGCIAIFLVASAASFIIWTFLPILTVIFFISGFRLLAN